MRAKVGHFVEGSFKEIAAGSEEYCRGYLDAYNLGSVISAVILVGDHCQCGPNRKETVQPEDNLFLRRTGCLRCDRWDSPPQLKNR
ncbi:MAG: hypothetical protein CL902_01020 [Dehalococcoidia bacterium]|mgnify:CR=1 FL=1|nr:hypothetical protein [Dehalococcoidia bacterium]